MSQPVSYSLRLAWRSVVSARGATVFAMLTLGIGLSATVALLGVIDAGARSLPVPDGNRIVELEIRNARAERVTPPAPIDEWALGFGVESAGALRQIQATLTHARALSQRANGAAMHPAVLRLLELPPALGRLPTDDRADESAIVLGWDVWQVMGADPALLGTRLDVDGRPHTIIGVMPQGFGFPEKHSFWTVLPRQESGEIVARLTRGVDLDATARAVQSRLGQSALAFADGPPRVTAQRWTNSRDGGGEVMALAALGTLVLLLLLVCCANVATILLVRGNIRANALAVHAALGATRTQVTAQLFLECVFIAVGGGIVGLAGGFAMLRWMQLNLSQHWGYYWMTMEVRPPVLLATFGLVLLAALLAGTIPSLRAARANISGVLVGSGRDRHGPAQRRLGRWFVGAQVTLSTLGLIAAVFLAWQFSRIDRITERLPVADVAVGAVVLPEEQYRDPATRAALVADLRAALGRIPGVTNVSITAAIPGGGSGAGALHRADAAADAPPVDVTWVAADERMTDVYRMRVIAGRTFDARDTHGSAPVVLVSDAFARAHYTDHAVGRHVRIPAVHDDGRWAEIIGVVQDWLPEAPGTRAQRVFLPLPQTASARLYFSLATHGEPHRVLTGVRTAIAGVDRVLPVVELETLDSRMRYFTRMYRVIAGFGMLGGIGSALIAGIGLYGVMAFQVRTRRREIGVRMAVGAARSRIMLDVVREGALRVVPGLAVGIALAAVTVPVIRGSQTQTAIAIPLLLISTVVALVLLLIGVLAAAEPALRASRLDPQDVLRSD